MSTAVQAPPADGLSDKDYKRFCADFKKYTLIALKRMQEYAKTFARMSKVQLKDFRTRFGKFVTADYLNRLVKYGRGQIGKHLAQPVPLWSNAQLEAMVPSMRKLVNNPKSEIPVYVNKSVVKKRVEELTQWETDKVFDAKTGEQRAPKEQKIYERISVNAGECCSRKENTDCWTYAGFEVVESTVMMRFTTLGVNDKFGRITIAQLEKLLADVKKTS